MKKARVVISLLAALAPVLVFATCGCGGGGTAAPTVPPFLDLATFQAAALVIGQADLTSNIPAIAPTQTGLWAPSGPVAEGSFYVTDFVNNRVLGYVNPPTMNNAPADFVLGQTDFNSNGAGESATQLDRPTGLAVAGGRLFVSDWNNDRVLIWNTLPMVTSTPADVVVGQADFVGGAPGTSQIRHRGPVGVFAVGSRLIVADQLNDRVLIYNAIPAANNAPADLVLGQPDFTTSGANAGATGLNNPTGLWSDGTRLIVSDHDNNRVLIWNTFPTMNQQPADLVLGQNNFLSVAPAAGPARMRSPTGVSSNGTQIFVADSDNHRVLVFDAFPSVNGEAAARVLGQGDFTHITKNDDDQDNVDDGAPTARTFDTPTGVQVGRNERLYVTDDLNNRVLIFLGM